MAQHEVIIVYKMKDEVSPGIDKIDNKTDKLKRTTEKADDRMKKLSNTNFSKMSSQLLRLGALIGAGLGLREVINTTAEFQKQQAVLSTMFGENVGAAYFENLKKQAETLPASMGEITSAFVKLNGVGITATNEELRSLSDLASAAGKNVLEASEAVVGAVTGEYERLKGLNIVARVNGNKLTLMYKNQKTTIDNNTESIRKYIIGLGNMKGVAGSSNKIMNTMGGVMSNIGDSFSNIAFELGKALLPLMKKLGELIGWISSKTPAIINFFKEWGGVIKPVLAGITGLFVISKLITIVQGFRVAFATLNTTMLLNPFVAIAAAVTALGVALYELQKRFGGFGNLWKHLTENIDKGFKAYRAAFDFLLYYIESNVQLSLLKVESYIFEVTGRIQKQIEVTSLLMKGKVNQAKYLQNKPFENTLTKEYEKQKKLADNMNLALAVRFKLTKKISDLHNEKMWDIWKGKVDPLTGKPITTETPTTSITGTGTDTTTPIAPGLTELTSQSNVKYVNISVNKMIENFTISTTNLTESNGKIKEEILTVLRSVIADASSIQN